MKSFLKKIALVILLIILGFLLFFPGYFFFSKPKYKGSVSVQGLKEEVKIITDTWGVPHIYADTEKDLFFACGYIHANERMWQMDLTRRTGYGRLSELFGEALLERDRFVRVIGLKEAALMDYELLPPEIKDMLVAYSQGVNAWLDSRRWKWPPEFSLMRYRPEPWNPLDSLIIKQVMAMLLSTDFPSEAVRSNLIYRMGQERALQVLEEGVKPPSFETEKISLSMLLDIVYPQQTNNWILSGDRTISGKPLLANDPHLEINLPPVWYEMHLHCSSLNVMGVTIPGLPWVIIGHNDAIAWGLSNSTVDAQDLYIEKFNETKDMYWEKNGWVPLMRKEEVIQVKGRREPENLEVTWTKRGPVISPHIIESQNPISLKWTIHQGDRVFKAGYLLNKAQNWDDFAAALSLFDSPSQNFGYADKNNNIGYYLGGKIPLRTEEAALFPFPSWREGGDWQGYLEEDQKPNLYNPEEGLIVTANQNILPEDYPFYVSFDWDAPFRANRIKEFLLQKSKHSVSSLQSLQGDIYSQKGELIKPLIRNIAGAQGKLKQALNILQNWDLQMDSGNAPALYATFMNFFPEEIFRDELKEDFRSFDFFFRRKMAGVLRILSEPDSFWFDNKETPEIEKREDVIKSTLIRAYNRLDWLYGSPENWDWSKMNAIRYQHPLGRLFIFRFFNLGSHPSNGNAFTVKVNYLTSHKTSWSASYRQVIDLSDWDKSVCVISSGQSGHFLSRFYDNQVPLWLGGEYHPMVFSRDGVEKNASATLILKPPKGK
ncbi:MAG: penicillin acylase family protein [Candidatus Aminicenantes bacterium]|nr:MAG: penicillin acylase family protein [Candidatus Aminicenantes bacterium]